MARDDTDGRWATDRAAPGFALRPMLVFWVTMHACAARMPALPGLVYEPARFTAIPLTSCLAGLHDRSQGITLCR